MKSGGRRGRLRGEAATGRFSCRGVDLVLEQEATEREKGGGRAIRSQGREELYRLTPEEWLHKRGVELRPEGSVSVLFLLVV
jgi:hypothetical protein